MTKDDHIILGVHITDRIKHVGQIQQVLTEYGCYVKTRLGLHDAGKDFCSPNGLMILELAGDAKKCAELEQKLKAITGTDVQKMVFTHD
jgi:hypothetical protein